jgi:hypothetical protein
VFTAEGHAPDHLLVLTCLLKGVAPVHRRRLVVAAAVDFSVRPYTIRKGDTLDSIAKKRGDVLACVLRCSAASAFR